MITPPLPPAAGHAGDPGRYRLQHWPDGLVIFDRATGDTHALDPLSAAIFLSRVQFRHNASALPAFLRASFPELAVPEDDEAVRMAVDKLASLGLWDHETR